MKPRTISQKREQANKAWQDWRDGKITNDVRNELAKPYAETVGLSVAKPSDVDDVREALREARRAAQSARMTRDPDKATQRFRTAERAEIMAGRKRDNIREREQEVQSKIDAGKVKVAKEMARSVEIGKKSADDVYKSQVAWADSMERNKRSHAEAKAESLKTHGFTDDNRIPGVEWRGGQLRAGSAAGETMPMLMAVADIVDKYARSTLPKSDILPNLNFRFIDASGQQIDGKVPTELVTLIKEQCQAGQNPDIGEIVAWFEDQDWFDRDNDDIDLYADDADSFVS